MPNTMRGDFQNLICSDCGEKGYVFVHRSFCGFCWIEREKRRKNGEDPLPFGVKPPGIPEEFKNYSLAVTTASKSVYLLIKTGEKEEERIVCGVEKSLPFTKARVMCLKVDVGLVLKPRDGEDLILLFTAPVEKIKPISI